MQLHKWIKDLEGNDKQAEAFYKPDNTVVIAGPGSGKTKVLTTKIAKLLSEEIRVPQGILCLTYTRMMAKEIEQRLYSLGIQDRPNIFVGTVHGFCLSHIVIPYAKLFGVKIPDIIRIAPKEMVKNLRIQVLKKYLGYIDKKTIDQFNILRRLRSDIKIREWDDFKEYGWAVAAYEKHLFNEGFLDFDLIIKIGLRLIMSQELVRNFLFAKFPWMAIDEYQDLGYPLYRIVTEMMDKTPTKLLAIGDPNQSIFDFAGTDPKYLIKLSKRADVQPTIVLNKNYRSAQEIINIGNAVLLTNTGIFSEYTGGKCSIIACKNFSEQITRSIDIVARLLPEIKPSDIAILHRKREEINRIASFLDEKKIAYVIDRHQYYDRSMMIIKWLEDMAYWSLSGWKSDSAVRHSLDELLSFWFELGANNVLGYEEDENKARIYLTGVLWKIKDPDILLGSWLEYIYQNLSLDILLEKYAVVNPDEVNEFNNLMKLSKEGERLEKTTIGKFSNLKPGICLTTIHSAKGAEFKSVIITGVEEIDNSENEKRVLYVGVTRAKTYIHLLYTQRGTAIPEYIESIKKHARDKSWKFVSFSE